MGTTRPVRPGCRADRRTTSYRSAVRARLGREPRISTCFLVDDYFTQFSSPREVLPMLHEAAAAAGLTIDYLAREDAAAADFPLGDEIVCHKVPLGRRSARFAPVW